MTKKEMFAQVIAMAKGEEITVAHEEIVNFAEHEIELLSKKASGTAKPTKVQIENEGYKAVILEILETSEFALSISEMMEDARLEGLTNQRVSALVTQLKKADKVIRGEKKKKAVFTVAGREIKFKTEQ